MKFSDDKFDVNSYRLTKSLIEEILKDHTTDRHIVWASNDYEHIKANDEMFSYQIVSDDAPIIITRNKKSDDFKINRTKVNGEVFTPLWICNKQNNIVDNDWILNKFNSELPDSWITNNEKISFVNGKDWKDYVKSIRLEITCGEAPYITSRYDLNSGNYLDVYNRIGFFDRKLRIINENTDNEDDWKHWTLEALKSTYGFEMQGDSLFIARKNIIITIIENFYFVYKKKVDNKFLLDCANIVSWNLWQMNALTYKIPCSEDINEEINLFNYNDPYESHYCLVKDWATNNVVRFKDIIEGCENE